MDDYQLLINTISLTMGVAWASGINLYAALLILGIGGATGNIELPETLAIVENPMVMLAAGVMYFTEFFVDKIPGVDTGWDAIHTFIRIPAGAMLAASSVGDVSPALEVAAGLMGGGIATTSHFTKAGTRAVANTSPEPFTNWGLSIGEDVTVIGGMYLMLQNPTLFIILIVVFIGLAIWLLPKLWRGIKHIVRTIRGWFGAKPNDEADDNAEHIAALKKLFVSGVLTEEEFLAKKAALETPATTQL